MKTNNDSNEKYNELIIGQEFKNYKEVCTFLNESVKRGNAQTAQFKNWQRYFLWERDKHKFIITDVFDTPKEKVDKRGGNNNKNIRPMIQYFLNNFNSSYLNEYLSFSQFYAKVFPIFNNEYFQDICNLIEDESYTSTYNLTLNKKDLKIAKLWLSLVRNVLQDQIQKTLRYLEKNEIITGENGYKFIYRSDNYFLSVGTELLNDYIDAMETNLCNDLMESDPRFEQFRSVVKGTGRQLKYFLIARNRKDLLTIYNERKMQHLYEDKLNDDESVIEILNMEIRIYAKEHPFVNIDGSYSRRFLNFISEEPSERLVGYYKAYKIKSFDSDKNNMEYVSENGLFQDILSSVINVAFNLLINRKEYKQVYNDRYGNMDYVAQYPYRNNHIVDLLNQINKHVFCATPLYIIPDLDQVEIEDDREEQLDNFIHDYAVGNIQIPHIHTDKHVDAIKEKAEKACKEYEATVDWDDFIDDYCTKNHIGVNDDLYFC